MMPDGFVCHPGLERRIQVGHLEGVVTGLVSYGEQVGQASGAPGRKKRNYTPIYNRYVYGYMESGIWRMLMAALPKQMIRTIEKTIKTVK